MVEFLLVCNYFCDRTLEMTTAILSDLGIWLRHSIYKLFHNVLCRYYQDLAPGLAKEYDLTYQPDLERMMMSLLEALSK